MTSQPWPAVWSPGLPQTTPAPHQDRNKTPYPLDFLRPARFSEGALGGFGPRVREGKPSHRATQKGIGGSQLSVLSVEGCYLVQFFF